MGVWFFDHQPVINAILFGQYRALMTETLRRFEARHQGRVLQLTCVYGELTPKLASRMQSGLHLMDVAPVQLALAKDKVRAADNDPPLYVARMNAEHLAYRDDAFDTIILFFLLHEMPPEARRCALTEAMRILKPGGRMIITEYGALPKHHLLYRLMPCRWLLQRLEPFLPGFWREDLAEQLDLAANRHGKSILPVDHVASYFSGFYRVAEYAVSACASKK